MKILIKESQYLRNLKEEESLIEPKLVILFKRLNEEKKKYKTRAELLDRIKSLIQFFNIPKGFELFILELYLLNYRKDGDYSSITKDNFVDPRKMKGKVTPNTRADLYTKAQLPFRGSNLHGLWLNDPKGVPYYKVESYGWYPIYIFKDGKWYEATKRYSSSTSRQMSNANPVKWDEKIDENVYPLTEKEMNLLESGYSHEEVMKHKMMSLLKSKNDFISNRIRTIKTQRWWWDADDDYIPVSIKYKISSIEPLDDKMKINVDIYDVVKVDPRSKLEMGTTENYLKNEIPGVTPEFVETQIEKILKREFYDFVGQRIRYNEKLPEKSKVVFDFKHLKN